MRKKNQTVSILLVFVLLVSVFSGYVLADPPTPLTGTAKPEIGEGVVWYTNFQESNLDPSLPFSDTADRNNFRKAANGISGNRYYTTNQSAYITAYINVANAGWYHIKLGHMQGVQVDYALISVNGGEDKTFVSRAETAEGGQYWDDWGDYYLNAGTNTVKLSKSTDGSDPDRNNALRFDTIQIEPTEGGPVPSETPSSEPTADSSEPPATGNTTYLNETFEGIDSITLTPGDRTKWRGASTPAVTASIVKEPAGSQSLHFQGINASGNQYLYAPEFNPKPAASSRLIVDTKFKNTTASTGKMNQMIFREDNNGKTNAVLHFAFEGKSDGVSTIQYVDNATDLVKNEELEFNDSAWYRLIAVLNTETLDYSFYVYNDQDELLKAFTGLKAYKGMYGASAPSNLCTLEYMMQDNVGALTVDYVKVFTDDTFILPGNPSPAPSLSPAPSVKPSPTPGIAEDAIIIRPGEDAEGFSYEPEVGTAVNSNWMISNSVPHACDDGTKSWYTNSTNAWAKYHPNITEPGLYDVYAWVPPGNSTIGTVTVGGEELPFENSILSSASDTAGWKLAGSYYFTGSGDEFVTLTKGPGYMRAASIAFQKAYAKPLASHISLSGQIYAGGTVSLTYDYSDANRTEPETGSTYTLYSAEFADAEQWETLGTGSCVGGQTTSISIPASAANQYIKIGVTPRNQADHNPEGDEAFTDVFGPLAGGEEKPTASDVKIQGNAKAGEILTGTYSYSDANYDTESGSIYKWLAADSAESTEWETIQTGISTSSSPLTLKIEEEYVGKYIKLSIIPKNTAANGTGDEVFSDVLGPVSASDLSQAGVKDITFGGQIVGVEGTDHYDAHVSASYKTPPLEEQEASETIDIIGAAVGGQIEFDYTYTHQNGLPEDTANTQFQWYTTYRKYPTKNDIVPISGATQSTYTPSMADAGKYIVLGIRPACTDGTIGEEVLSRALKVKWELSFYDEFNYSMDDGRDPQFTQKWQSEDYPRPPHKFGRYPENLTADGEYLYITNKTDDNKRPDEVDENGNPLYPWSTGSFAAYDTNTQAKKLFGYGYFEAKYKYSAVDGSNNSFWLITPGNVVAPGGHEIDINEGHYPNKVNSQLHFWDTRVDPQKADTDYHSKPKITDTSGNPVDLSADFHTYGGYWSEDYFAWTFDDKMHGVFENQWAFTEANLRFSVALIEWASSTGELIEEDIDGTQTVIDYIRYYKPLQAEKSTLDNLILTAQNILDNATSGSEAGKYSPAAINDLSGLISQAQTVSNNNNASAEEIQAAYEALSNGLDEFTQQRSGDTSELLSIVEKAEKLLEDYPVGNGFLQSNAARFNALQSVAQEGRTLVNSDYPSEIAMKDMISSIESAITQFQAALHYSGTADSNKTIDLTYCTAKAEITIPAAYNPAVILPDTITRDIIITRQLNNGTVKITIPAGAQLSGNFMLPANGNVTSADFDVVYSAVMNGLKATNDTAIRLEFNNSRNSMVGTFDTSSSITPITATINSDTQEAALAALDTVQAVKYGNDPVVVYTKELSDYVIYREKSSSVTPTPNPTPTPNQGTSGPGTGIIIPPSGSSNDKVTFTDITGHWAEQEIRELAEDGIVNGRSENEFAPEDNITRAEFAALIVRALGRNPALYHGGFNDVNANDWFAGYVAAIVDSGIMNGDTESTFRPNDVITREEMAKVMVNAYKLKTGTTEISSPDISFHDTTDISPWAQDFVKQATGLGLMNGMGDGNFSPKGWATRAQAAVVIYRLVK